MRARRFFSFLFLTVSIVLLVSCIFVTNIDEISAARKIFKIQESPTTVVAYSLLKRIELEGAEFDCPNEKNDDADEIQAAEVENNIWVRIQDSSVFVRSVHLDSRLSPFDYVRIVAMVRGEWKSPRLFCQITTSEDNRYHITRTTITKIWSKSFNRNDSTPYYDPYLLSCKLPSDTKSTHVAISVYQNPCQINHQQTFKIPSRSPPQTKRSQFTICVKPLNFPEEDISQKILKWIVINQIFGADKFEIYIDKIPETCREFLKQLKKVSDVQINLHNFTAISQDFNPEDVVQKLWQKRRYELIAYNDCLYRNTNSSRFLIPVDIDEIIVPRRGGTWAELFHRAGLSGRENVASFTVRNAYYLRTFNTPPSSDREIFFFRDLVRSFYSGVGESGKSFVNVKNTLTVFNHYALEALTPGVRRVEFVPVEDAQMNHYRNGCSAAILPQCYKHLDGHVRVFDDVIVTYKDVFYEKYREILSRMCV